MRFLIPSFSLVFLYKLSFATVQIFSLREFHERLQELNAVREKGTRLVETAKKQGRCTTQFRCEFAN